MSEPAAKRSKPDSSSADGAIVAQDLSCVGDGCDASVKMLTADE
jgi:hypothetical protein